METRGDKAMAAWKVGKELGFQVANEEEMIEALAKTKKGTRMEGIKKRGSHRRREEEKEPGGCLFNCQNDSCLLEDKGCRGVVAKVQRSGRWKWK